MAATTRAGGVRGARRAGGARGAGARQRGRRGRGGRARRGGARRRGCFSGRCSSWRAGRARGCIAIDGRVRQPGLGHPAAPGRRRGRGGARLRRGWACPALPAALATALASLGSGDAAARGRSGARGARARVRRSAPPCSSRSRGAGPRAMTDEAIASELARRGGARGRRDAHRRRSRRGPPRDGQRATRRSVAPTGILRVPWRSEGLAGSRDARGRGGRRARPGRHRLLRGPGGRRRRAGSRPARPAPSRRPSCGARRASARASRGRPRRPSPCARGAASWTSPSGLAARGGRRGLPRGAARPRWTTRRCSLEAIAAAPGARGRARPHRRDRGGRRVALRAPKAPALELRRARG